MTQPRSVLVTGATGLIGSALVRLLHAENIPVYCLIRRGSLSKLPPLSGVEAIEVPTFETETLRRSLSGIACDTAFHLASYGVQINDRDRDQLIAGNVGLLSHVLEAISEHAPGKFLYAGSCSEYGFPVKDGQPISEDQPLRPTSLYGAAKAAAEVYGQALALQLKIPFTALRLFNVFGPGEAPHRLLPSIIQALDQHRPVDLTGGEQQRDLLHVDDVAGALLAAARSQQLKAFAAYNVCSGQPVRIREVGETAARLMGKSKHLLKWGALPYRSDEPMWVVGEPARFQQDTPWHPKMNLTEGIRSMVAALRNREHQNAV